VRLSQFGTAATTFLLNQPQMIDDGDCGAIGEMKIGRRNRSTRRKPAPVPLCPPQIPHDLTRARTRVAAVWSRRLTAWAMARPYVSTYASGLFDKGSSSGFIVRHSPSLAGTVLTSHQLEGSLLCVHMFIVSVKRPTLCNRLSTSSSVRNIGRTATEPTNREETLDRLRISSGLLGLKGAQFLLKMIQVPVVGYRRAARKHSFVLVTKFVG
jgi:hypothetical protein